MSKPRSHAHSMFGDHAHIFQEQAEMRQCNVQAFLPISTSVLRSVGNSVLSLLLLKRPLHAICLQSIRVISLNNLNMQGTNSHCIFEGGSLLPMQGTNSDKDKSWKHVLSAACSSSPSFKPGTCGAMSQPPPTRILAGDASTLGWSSSAKRGHCGAKWPNFAPEFNLTSSEIRNRILNFKLQ